MVIKLRVKEQTISLLSTKSIPRTGSKDYLVLQFIFSTDWDNLSKIVYLQKDRVSEPIELVGDTLKVPEWFTEQDTFNVTLLGVGDTQEVPTNVVSIKLEKSNTIWNEDAPAPQPSWLVTVLEAAKRVEEAVVNPPKIGSNGNWFVWDFEAGAYVDTGVSASGGGSGAVSSVNGQTGAVELTAAEVGAISQDDLQEATNKALAQAKASGEFDGADGKTPEYGVDYGTPEQIAGIAQQAAERLQPEVEQIKGDLADLAPAGAAVGQLFRVAAISEDGKYTMEPVDMLDVRVDGESIVQDGVANIPIATNKSHGLVKTASNSGIYINNDGALLVSKSSNSFIDSRGSIYTPIVPNNIDYALKAAMCDGKGAAWTDVERIAALLRMGCTVDDNGFVKWKAQEVSE